MTIYISLHGNSRSKRAVQAAKYGHLGCSYEASVRAVPVRLHGSSCGLTREVQVVVRGSSGVLTRHFRKLDHDTRLKAVQVH
jgi:hypothetical protein